MYGCIPLMKPECEGVYDGMPYSNEQTKHHNIDTVRRALKDSACVSLIFVLLCTDL